MTSREKFQTLIKDSCDFVSDMNLYKEIEEDLGKLDEIKSLLYNAYNLEKNCVYLNDKLAGWLKENGTK